MLLSSLPQSKERAMVLRWKDEAELCVAKTEKRQKVLEAIGEGYDTLTEIMSETKMTKASCYKILRRLLRENCITKTIVQNSNKRTEFRFELVSKNP
jgi:NAD(P)H-nitrite reductase large subunit